MRGRPLPIAVAVLGLAVSPATLWAQEAEPATEPVAEPVPVEARAPAPPEAEAPQPAQPPVEAGAPAAPGAETPQPPVAPAHGTRPARADHETGASEAALARQSGASVAMVDFAFQPSSIQVTVGGAVTWTNNGAEPHTATGDGFDTGEVAAGASGSATFGQAGTFSYFCSIHPNMTGSVTVLAADDGAAPSGDNGTDDEGGIASPTEEEAVASPDAAGTGSALPATGEESGLLAALGLALLAVGTQLWVAQRLSPR